MSAELTSDDGFANGLSCATRHTLMAETPLENIKHLCAAMVLDGIRGLGEGPVAAAEQRAWILGSTRAVMTFEACVQALFADQLVDSARNDALDADRAALYVDELRERILREPQQVAAAFSAYLSSVQQSGVQRSPPRASLEAAEDPHEQMARVRVLRPGGA